MIRRRRAAKSSMPEWMYLCHVEGQRDVASSYCGEAAILQACPERAQRVERETSLNSFRLGGRDLIRSLPVRSASTLSVYVTAAPVAPFSNTLRYARNDRTLDWNGNVSCAREKLTNTTYLI